MERVPLCQGLWEEQEGTAYLLGSVCEDCGEVYFPPKSMDLCSCCQGSRLKPVRLSREGVIRSFTNVVQKPAGGYYKGPVPFLYALVELPDGVLIQTHITEADPETLAIGDRVELVIKPLYTEGEQEVVSYFFRPIEKGGARA